MTITKNAVIQSDTDESLYRVLLLQNNQMLIVNCQSKERPTWIPMEKASAYRITEDPFVSPELNDLTPVQRRKAIERFTMISAAVSVMGEKALRTKMIDQAANQYGVSKQTLRSYLWTFLVFQNPSALAPKETKEKPLTSHQKNIRWALNKFYYTQHKNSLPCAYTMMLKEKYCDSAGKLLPHPTFAQFKYYYLKTKKMDHYYISRNGMKNYLRNNRPLLGDCGVQDYAPVLGTAMLDSTLCDIYLVDDAGRLIGRPLLVAAVDTNSSLCLGYSLLWEGGTYSLHKLMLNMISDKVELCRKMGISISADQWPNRELPTVMVTDGGTEYTSKNFEQITELGVQLVNLPPYRPELKGVIEKFFDLVQSIYKNELKGKGVLMPDYQERGSHDYRKDAVLTLQDFERILVRCIVYYNSERIIENYPYSEQMVQVKTKPHASDIWNYKRAEHGNNLISVSSRDLMLTLLPRTKGRFDRKGLHVNKLRYEADGYREQFLNGGEATVAYNPDNTSMVWVKEKDGSFVEFDLIESRYAEQSFDQARSSMTAKKQLLSKDTVNQNQQAQIDTLRFISAVAENKRPKKGGTKNVRKTRAAQRRKNHTDLGAVIHES